MSTLEGKGLNEKLCCSKLTKLNVMRVGQVPKRCRCGFDSLIPLETLVPAPFFCPFFFFGCCRLKSLVCVCASGCVRCCVTLNE